MKNQTITKKEKDEKAGLEVKVALITDGAYIVPTAVAVKSIIDNVNAKRKYNISVICDNVNVEDKYALEKCAEGCPNVTVTCIDADSEELALLHGELNSNFMVATTTALLKFNLANIFSTSEKLLYLDGDILVNCDVAEIFDTELGDNYVAAVRDLPQVFFAKQDFGDDSEYFNSGVMLLNLSKMREDGIREKLIKTKRESVGDRLMDQNVLNKVFKGKVLQLHFKYNLPYCLFTTLRNFDYSKLSSHYNEAGIKGLNDLVNYASILHFSSYLKPWIYNDSPFADEWYNCFMNSPVRDYPLTRVSSFGQDLKAFRKLKGILKNKNEFDRQGKTLLPPVPITPSCGISIIVPCYNQEKTIEECLMSAVNQTFKDVEIIVVNDCSTDASLEILRRMQNKYSQIKIIDLPENGGTSNARKVGVLSSVGKYVMFLDSDDALEPMACETLYNAMEEKGVDILQFGVNVINRGVSQKTFEWFQWFVRPFTDYINDEEIFFACHEKSRINYILWNKIYNGALARKAFYCVTDGYFLMGEDLYVHAMMLFFAKTYTGITDKLYIYNYGGGLTGSSSGSFAKFKKIAPQMRLVEHLFKFIDENQFINCDRYFKALKKVNENFLNNVCNNYSKLPEKEKNQSFEFLLEVLCPTIDEKDYINEAAYAEVINEFFENIDTLFYAKFMRRKGEIYDFLKNYLESCGMLDRYDERFTGRLYKEIYENKEFDKVDKNKIVPVVFASNMNYAPYIGVSIQSLIDNSSPDRFYDIYVLHSNIDDLTQHLIAGMCVENTRISFINLVNMTKGLSLYTNFHISIETYFRFFIPELLYRYDKVLYLDCDIAINDDVAKLYDTDVSAYPIAAVHNELFKQSTINYIKNDLKINPNDYFNAGVLVINCRKFDVQRIKDRSMDELHKKKLMLMDQDALNLVCKDNYLKLDGRWNFQVGCDKFSVEEKYSVDVGIYHYTSGNKPWNTKQIALGEFFWKAARKTPFYEQILHIYLTKTLSFPSVQSVATHTSVPASVNQEKPSQKKTKKKRKITWPFRMIRNFFKCWHNCGFKFTMHCVKIKIKYVFNRILRRVDEYNRPINGKERKTQKLYATQSLRYHYYKSLSPKEYSKELETWYNKRMGETMDINNPRTFNQKMQWLKLYDSTILKSHLTDKWLAKEYVKSLLGEEYIIKTLGVYDKFDDIDFASLPEKFVIKSTHGSGQIAIIKDKSKMDLTKLRENVEGWLKINYAYNLGLELHYANIIPRIIVEEFMPGINDDLYDYKVLCFNGKVQLIWVDTSRFTNHQRTLFDSKWNIMPVNLQWENSSKKIPKPKNLDLLIRLAETLSKPFCQARCDFYILNDGSIKFGELTFTSASGVDRWKPSSFDVELGERLVLPEPTKFKKLSRKQIKKAEETFLKNLSCE